MRGAVMQRLIWLSIAALAVAVSSQAQQPSRVDDERAQAAELKMLRAQVERLTKENAELRVKLTAAITPLRPTPVTQPTAATKPATALAPKGAGKKVMYLLDGSGSMVNVFDAARMEVRKAIDDLAAGDAFNVIFDSDNFSSAFPA